MERDGLATDFAAGVMLLLHIRTGFAQHTQSIHPQQGSRMAKRVGIIALLHESNTFLDQPTTMDHFASDVLCDGDQVLNTFRGSQHEVGGFVEILDATPDVQPLGVFAARAVPYGVITTDCWEALMTRMQNQLQAIGPLDGLLVAPHGAAVAAHRFDADGDWLMRVRHRVGLSVPIIGTLDLHANVSLTMINACQALLGYRTNPHLDQRARGAAAAVLMLRTLRGEIHPTQTLVQLPLCVNIERQATGEPHGQRLWAAAEQMLVQHHAMLDVSCFYGFPYADVPEMGSSVLTVTDSEKQLAQRTAGELAKFWWQRRQEFSSQLLSMDQAVARAGRHRDKTARSGCWTWEITSAVVRRAMEPY